MAAKIIETNDTPLKKVEVEGVTADIIENALKNARIEMDAVLFRTAMSPGIREQGDCFPMIANKEGKNLRMIWPLRLLKNPKKIQTLLIKILLAMYLLILTAVIRQITIWKSQ